MRNEFRVRNARSISIHKSNRRGIEVSESSQLQSINATMARWRLLQWCNDFFRTYTRDYMRVIFRSKYNDAFQVFVLVLFVHVIVFVSFSVHTVQLCEPEKRVPDTPVTSRFAICGHDSIGKFWAEIKIKMGRIVLKRHVAQMFSSVNSLWVKIDSTRVSETAFQFERKAHPLRSRCIEFVSIRPIECYLYVRVYRAGIGTNKSEIGSLWRNVWLLKRFDPLHSRIEFAFNRSTLSVDEEDGSLVSITSWNVSRGVKQRPRGDALSLSSYSRETIDFRSIAVITAMSATQSQ